MITDTLRCNTGYNGTLRAVLRNVAKVVDPMSEKKDFHQIFSERECFRGTTIILRIIVVTS